MEPIVSAVVSDLLGRSISFAIDRYFHRRHEGTVQENLQRLRRVLLRIQVTVEEADRRRVTNQAMLQQLHLLREGMYRGYYLLNAVMRHQDDKAAREVSGHKHSSLALSEFNPAKRICLLPAARTTPTPTAVTAAPYTGHEAEAELQEVLMDLERMAGDMKELVLFLSCYPPLLREPYSRHLWLENRMFGREAEYERIIRFLLEPEPAGDLAVLPVIGRTRVGKSTLVEHVWRDERVRKHFSLIVFFRESDIVDGKLQLMPLGDCGVIKYRNEDLASTTGSSLVVTELAGAVDERAWSRALSTLIKSQDTAPVRKIVVTSRSEMVERFGTVKALELKPLSREAYWYFFKTIAFGSTSTDAQEQLELASVCMEIADLLDGSFIGANIVGGLLRNNLYAAFWYKVLRCIKDYTSMHLDSFGERPAHRVWNEQPIYLWRLSKTDSMLIAYGCYEVCSVQKPDLPKLTIQDVHAGSTTPGGKFEALAWRSYIPPYSSYVVRCGVSSSFLRISPTRNKQLRQQQASLTLM